MKAKNFKGNCINCCTQRKYWCWNSWHPIVTLQKAYLVTAWYSVENPKGCRDGRFGGIDGECTKCWLCEGEEAALFPIRDGDCQPLVWYLGDPPPSSQRVQSTDYGTAGHHSQPFWTKSYQALWIEPYQAGLTFHFHCEWIHTALGSWFSLATQ